MTEKLAKDLPGGCYYLRFEAAPQRILFSHPQEREQIRPLLQHFCQRFKQPLYGYCLLTDSIHLVVPACDLGIDAMAQWLWQTFTDGYNALHQRHGNVLQHEFIFTLIEPGRYLLPVIQQLHRLPVTADIVATPSAYPYSSHRDYLSADSISWLDKQAVLRLVTHQRATQLRRYESLMDFEGEALDWFHGSHPHYRALASDEYIERLIKRQQDRRPEQPPSLDTITEWACEENKLEEQDLVLRRRHRLGLEVQAEIAAIAKHFGSAKEKTVAQYFECDLELLLGAMRGLEARRAMYLHSLILRLEKRWRDMNASQPHPQDQANG